METKIAIDWTTIFLGFIGILISILSFFILRIVKGYDSQVKDLFERTKDLPAIREAIDWIKDELRKK